jgi:hypothetical protein
MLLALAIETGSVLIPSLKTSEQKIWERSHLNAKTYHKRRKELWVRFAIASTIAALCLYAGAMCLGEFRELSQTQGYVSGRDRAGESLFGGGGFMVISLACSIYAGVIRAKLKAIRQLNRNEGKSSA